MELDNSKLPINILLDKINEAAKGNQGITLTDEETKLLCKEVGDLVIIPFLSNEDILNMQAQVEQNNCRFIK